MPDDLVTSMVPVLGRSLDPGFNVFDVMHHGMHEKQISNVFRWLLDPGGSHGLGEKFMRIFVSEVNHGGDRSVPFPVDGYWVRQEVNTTGSAEQADIADLVLESEAAVLVVENYLVSDGHGHSYDRYLAYAERRGRQGAVVLLCSEERESAQTRGWEQAAVVTYATLVQQLHDAVIGDEAYRRTNPEAFAFIDQMHRKFVKGRGRVEDHDVLGFVVAMCESGEARRYQAQRQEVAAELFASDLAEQARERFGEGRVLLQRVKARLRSFSAEVLAHQLNATFGEGFVRSVSARYAGIYQWTINFSLREAGAEAVEARLQVKFGPSAWFANEQDVDWRHTVDPAVADYSRVFLTRGETSEVEQSAVTLQEVLDGLDPDDRRLHDEIVLMVDGRA